MVVPIQEFVFVTVGLVDTAIFGLNVQDVGSAVLAFGAAVVALIFGDRGQPMSRNLGAAAIVGLVTLIVDRFG